MPRDRCRRVHRLYAARSRPVCGACVPRPDGVGAPLPGVRLLVADAKRRGLPLAVASSSRATSVVPHLQQFGLRDRFDVVVIRRPVTHTKPAPPSMCWRRGASEWPGRVSGDAVLTPAYVTVHNLPIPVTGHIGPGSRAEPSRGQRMAAGISDSTACPGLAGNRREAQRLTSSPGGA
ncbi:HAD hydrolase-like protein [Streptomyces sp. NPDC001663]|uniref:HAD hydrolase-like protein n=1 Tax=Streptomyces sp. NPDC001663 TaxID=3364597 RepID=UPI0036A2A371